MACRKEHGLPDDEYGIKIAEFIWPITGGSNVDWQHQGKWEYTYVPVPLSACDLCAERAAQGKLPTCVHHCQAKCLEFGDVEELSKKLSGKARQTLFCLE